MKTSLSKRALVALGVAVAAILAMASPASATPVPYDFALTDGLITITNTDPFDLGDGPEADPCDVWDPPPVITIEVDHATSPVSTEVTAPLWGVDGPAAKWTSLNDTNNNWYQIDLYVLDDPSVDNTGELTGSAPVYAWDQSVYVVAEIYDLGNVGGLPEDCEKDDLVCMIGAQLELSGTYDHPNGVGDLDGSGNIDILFCDDATIQNQVANGSIGVDGLTLELLP